jgi:hypothetical protein
VQQGPGKRKGGETASPGFLPKEQARRIIRRMGCKCKGGANFGAHVHRRVEIRRNRRASAAGPTELRASERGRRRLGCTFEERARLVGTIDQVWSVRGEMTMLSVFHPQACNSFVLQTCSVGLGIQVKLKYNLARLTWPGDLERLSTDINMTVAVCPKYRRQGF